MPRVRDASYRSNEGLDTIRNMVTTTFMMNAEWGEGGIGCGDKPFSDNRKSVPETVFQSCPNGF